MTYRSSQERARHGLSTLLNSVRPGARLRLFSQTSWQGCLRFLLNAEIAFSLLVLMCTELKGRSRGLDVRARELGRAAKKFGASTLRQGSGFFIFAEGNVCGA